MERYPPEPRRWRGPVAYTLIIVCVQITCTCFNQSCRADEDGNKSSQEARATLLRQRTAEWIKYQQDKEAKRLDAQRGMQVTNRSADAQRQLELLRDLHQRTLNDMKNARVVVGPQSVPTYTASEIEEARKSMDFAEYAFQHRNWGTQELSADAQHRIDALDTSSANLQSQLSADQAKRGFKLSPVGTNLYVRNYQLGGTNDDTSDEQQSVGQHAHSLALPATEAAANSALVIKQGRLPVAQAQSKGGSMSQLQDKSGRLVRTSVTGQLLKL
jgi:hypothetical protein